MADQGDYDAARQLLMEKVVDLRSISPNSPLAVIAADDIAQLEHFQQRMEQQTYDRTDPIWTKRAVQTTQFWEAPKSADG